jgi:hypothetical protein
MQYPHSGRLRRVFILSTPLVSLGIHSTFFCLHRSLWSPSFAGKISRTIAHYNTRMYKHVAQNAGIGHPCTLTQYPCLIEQQFKTHLVQSDYAPNKLPWSNGSRNHIKTADPPFAPASVGGGATVEDPCRYGKNPAAPPGTTACSPSRFLYREQTSRTCLPCEDKRPHFT